MQVALIPLTKTSYFPFLPAPKPSIASGRLLHPPKHQALHHGVRLNGHLRLLDLLGHLAQQGLEAGAQLGAAADVLAVEVEQVEGDVDADAEVARVGDVLAHPLKERQHGQLVAALERLAQRRAVAQRHEHRQRRHRLVLGPGHVDDLVERGRVPPLAEVALPGLEMGPPHAPAVRVGRVGGDDHVDGLAEEVHGLVGHGRALPLGLSGVEFLQGGGAHVAGCLDRGALPGLLGGCAGEPGPERHDAGLHADGEMAVFLGGAGGDDRERQNRTRILGAGHDVPVARLEDLDMAVQTAADHAPPVRGEAEGRDGLLVVCDETEWLRCDKVENGDGAAGGSQEGRARWKREDIFDGIGVLEGHDGTAGRSRVPDADRLIVGARDEHVAVSAGHEGAATHVIRVPGKHAARLVRGQVPQTDRLVVTGAHQGGKLGRRPLRHPHGLLVDMPRLEYNGARATAHVKHLHPARVLAGDEHPAIGSDLAAVGLAVEAADGFEQLTLADGENVDTGARGHGEQVVELGGSDERVGERRAGGGGGEADVRDGPRGRRRVRFLVLERPPVPLLGRDGAGPRGQLHLRQREHFCRHFGLS
ncbi:49f6af0f-ab0b-4234-add8-fd24d8cd84cd [Thermothielavioides terrestris]|uniref:49f6af0f-ab0b-4234-add8-fd24d8cd84cd n=1 Tax=Thermothielavioides terrestris TaxID=2587410 RepID=A0A446BEL1_9PEZI|nr:49f6af0f-ab0b-4234-add8-fd24d8cd84cd [Thermothielavioides terrestris]